MMFAVIGVVCFIAGFAVACRLFAAMKEDLLSTFTKPPKR